MPDRGERDLDDPQRRAASALVDGPVLGRSAPVVELVERAAVVGHQRPRARRTARSRAAPRPG